MKVDGSLVLKAYSKLKKKILDREFYPGEVLIESSLSTSLSMSRTPIREALCMLEKEGLVLTVGSKKQVAVISAEELWQIFEAKEALETKIMKSAALNCSDDDKIILNSYIVKFKALKKAFHEKENDEEIFKEWNKLNDDFHNEFYRMSGNKRIKTMVDQLNQLWHSWRVGTLRIGNRFEDNIDEHIAMAESVIDKDIQAASDSMSNHLQSLFNLTNSLITAFRIH